MIPVSPGVTGPPRDTLHTTTAFHLPRTIRHWQNMAESWQNMADAAHCPYIAAYCPHIAAHCPHIAPLAEYGRTWQNMAEHGRTWQDMAEHGRTWQDMAEHGRTWQDMAEHGRTWQDMRSSTVRCSVHDTIPVDLVTMYQYMSPFLPVSYFLSLRNVLTFLRSPCT
jgi:hypothetical protein